MAAITAPGRPEQHDPPAKPAAAPPPPPGPIDLAKALEWAAYAGLLEAMLLRTAADISDGRLEGVLMVIDHRRPKP